jgi:hypothetical protein
VQCVSGVVDVAVARIRKELLPCWRRSKSEPPCRVNSEPGVEADA